MSEVMRIQEPIEKVGETASLPDENPYRESTRQKDNWYSLMAQMFHTPSVTGQPARHLVPDDESQSELTW